MTKSGAFAPLSDRLVRGDDEERQVVRDRKKQAVTCGEVTAENITVGNIARSGLNSRDNTAVGIYCQVILVTVKTLGL